MVLCEAEFLAYLRHHILRRFVPVRGDELGANVLHAQAFLIHRRAILSVALNLFNTGSNLSSCRQLLFEKGNCSSSEAGSSRLDPKLQSLRNGRLENGTQFRLVFLIL